MTKAGSYAVIMPSCNERKLTCSIAGYIISDSCDMTATTMELTAAYQWRMKVAHTGQTSYFAGTTLNKPMGE